MIKFIRSGVFFLILITGCTSYHIVKPVSPSVGNPNRDPAEVTSLQPTLTWEASPDTSVTYDLIIYEGRKDESFWKGTKRSIVDTAYYQEALTINSHTLQTALKPKTEYYWSVRVRRGNETSEWARYDYTVFLVLSYIKVRDAFFRFRTPDKI
jgi:hypothetical protein